VLSSGRRWREREDTERVTKEDTEREKREVVEVKAWWGLGDS
jgi:hypothetical protein